MTALLTQIARHAGERPDSVALDDGAVTLSYQRLWHEIARAHVLLDGRRAGLLASNGCGWAVIELALQRRGTVSVPMPPFFSDTQLAHLIHDAGLDIIITDQPERVARLVPKALTGELPVAGKIYTCFFFHPAQAPALPPGTSKITYTSGTTGQPKGVCLSHRAIGQVTTSLIQSVCATASDVAMSVLPLSTLLAEIGGIHIPLYSGGTACVPDLAECGMTGSTGVRAGALITALHRFRPTATIAVPYLLKLLTEAVAHGISLPDSLRFIAAGGAPVSPALLARARALDIPVYQGYGLSETASVVSLNTVESNRTGSAGKPLPHAGVRLAPDGEILVRGALCGGYLGQPPQNGGEWATGDLGFLDDEGYLYITGRKKTSYATAHGRNLSPEWVESELTAQPGIAQAAVFGEGRAFNVAVIVPATGTESAHIAAAIAAVNSRLPDYARVARWIRATEPFTPRNGLANGAGVPGRRAIAACYADQIEYHYEGDCFHAVL